MNPGDWRWLPYLLTVLTVGFVVRAFWADQRSHRVAAAAGALLTLVASLGSIATIVLDGATPGRGRQVAQSAPATSAVPVDESTSPTAAPPVSADVQGAVEVRADFDRIVTCETALAAIASAISNAATASAPTPGVSSVPELEPGSDDPERRLQSCEVRLRAIAATLPR
ncbi:MAG TPA: hypothetical protein PLV93_04990 [Microthrixaceae bacterium]|nr:hypothetical protein [Microthrixaceae bacterium]HNI34730.1 hypothetical protein [Microthrixaceae bacterium]